MSALIFGVGVGLFVIIALWAVALLLCLISLRGQRNVGYSGILVAAIVTGFLLLLPLDSPAEAQDTVKANKLYDHFFIWRILLLIFLGLSVISGSIIFVYTHLMEPKLAKPVFRQVKANID